MTNEAWLKSRQKFIGGSDSAAVLNISRYRSAYQTYMDKIGEGAPIPDNLKMRMGRKMEPIVAEEYTEDTGKHLIELNESRTAKKIFPDRELVVTNKGKKNETVSIIAKEYPFIGANIDRWIPDEKVGLEIKTASHYVAHEYKDGIPDEYMCQVQHYMLCTGCAYWYLAVLIGGNVDFKTFKVDRDDNLINDILIPRYKTFWNDHVLKRIEPKAIHLDFNSFQAGEQEEPIDLSVEILEMLNRLPDIDKNIKELDQKKKTIQALVKQFLGESQVGIWEDVRITHKPYKVNRFNTDGFKKDHPELYQKYKKESEYSKLMIRRLGK